MFFNKLKTNLRNGAPLDMDQSNREMAAFEWKWTGQQQDFYGEPKGNPLEIVREIHKKYIGLLHQVF